MKTVRAILIVLASALLLAAGPFVSAVKADPVCTISVKVVVDQKEPMLQQVWEKRYRDRLAAASNIFEQTCHVRFKVVAVGTWISDDNARDFEQFIKDFERKANPAPARLVIGFTGQYYKLREDVRIGGTHGPFRTHILISEWSHGVTDPERLEILVHELGHFLGAAHSPEHQSVMRPDISDRQSRRADFHISFDARNAKAMTLVVEGLSKRPLFHLAQLPPSTKEQLRTIYQSLAAGLPNDPAAPRYLAMLDQSLGVAGESPKRADDVIAGARIVVRAVTAAAEKNRKLPKKGAGGTGAAVRLEGDQLTDFYVRQAAAAAKRLPPSVAAPALLMGLGVALDDSPLLSNTPVIGAVWQRIESSSARLTRIESLGAPTMRGRRDWAQHFAVSAALAVLVGPQGAEVAGIRKEMTDAIGGSGFSFADYSADLAGIEFATAVSSGRIPLSRLESRFAVPDFLPEAKGLREGIMWKDFEKQYGIPPDPRLLRERDALRAKILAMPGLKDAAKRPTSGK
jgi:hypothetical protein